MSSHVKDQPIIKILLIGLDNSGKSSILLSFKEDTNLLSFFSLNPTKGLKIETALSPHSDMAIWELGGQKQYRDDYLKNFDKYLKDLDKVIYVIDIQDLERYDLAIKYLKDILNLLKKTGIQVDISIYLHKYDPNLSKMEKFKDIDKTITPELINTIEKVIPPDFKCSFYKTSIYTTFEKFLIK